MYGLFSTCVYTGSTPGSRDRFFPAGLTDKEGGKAPVIISFNDKSMEGWSILRADVAELCARNLSILEAKTSCLYVKLKLL
jgi:hypothetical protein